MESRKRAAKALRIALLIIILIAAIAIGSFIYFSYLVPKPGPPMFRYASTATYTEPTEGITFNFTYTPVSGTITTAIFVINVTRIDAVGTLEIRVAGASEHWFRNITATGPMQADFEPRTVLREGDNAISVVNWGFKGSFQFIVYVRTEQT